MNSRRPSDAETRSDNAPTLSLWLGVHLALVVVGMLLGLAFPKEAPGWFVAVP